MSLLLCDVDQPLCGWTQAVIGAGNEHAGTSYTLEHATEWDFDKKLWPDETVRQKIRAPMASPDWWLNLPAVDGAKDGIAAIRKAGHDLVFVTSPYESCKGWEHARREWLATHFDAGKHDVIPTDLKELVIGDVFLDDKPAHLKRWKRIHRSGIPVLFAQPHNTLADKFERFGWIGIKWLLTQLRYPTHTDFDWQKGKRK